MAQQFQSEIEAVNQLRAEFPHVAQRTLARKIITGDDNLFVTESQQTLRHKARGGCGVAPESTIYNRIRRFDANAKKAAASESQPVQTNEPVLV